MCISSRMTLKFFALALTFIAVQGDAVIKLSQGSLVGHTLKSRKGRTIYAYEGIPYGQPPIGDLRFKAPQPAGSWTGVLNATRSKPMCMQRSVYVNPGNLIGQEDCLYLNVFSPRKPTGFGTRELLPVMVYIYGGSFTFGSSDRYQPDYLLDKNIILVTFNYRVGPLGFLSTGDCECPGNNGLKDQLIVLKWVQNNIAKFGGNPKSVTIFGGSAGAASVHYHILSPASKGLFHRGISQSGSAVELWSLSAPNVNTNYSKKLAALLNCPTSSSSEMISCLRTKSPYNITGTDTNLTVWHSTPEIIFQPVVETEVGEGDFAFITEAPLYRFQSNEDFDLVPWLVGINSDEGASIASAIFSDPSTVQQFNAGFDQLLPLQLYYIYYAQNPQEVTERIREYYFGNEPITNDSIHKVVDMYTDGAIFYGVNLGVKLHAQRKALVYYYELTYRGTNSYSTLSGYQGNLGVCHQDELLYLFPQAKALFPNSTPSRCDEKMIDTLTTLWTNFAIKGNPTPLLSRFGKWKKVTSAGDPEYAVLNCSGVHMREGLYTNRFELWDSFKLNGTASKENN